MAGCYGERDAGLCVDALNDVLLIEMMIAWRYPDFRASLDFREMS